MDACFPGTVIRRQGKNAEEFLSGLFFATKGIMLLQLREITGLDTPVIQNWINRGWVERPEQKRYSRDHLARIMMINMLRDVTRLENIDMMLRYINSKEGESEKVIIPEAQLYIYICNILDQIDFETVLSEPDFDRIVERHLAGYKEPFPGALERLAGGVKMILTYYAAALIKVRGDNRFRALVGEDEEKE